MALESFLLHCRNLRDFLCPELQKCLNDDVVESDYFGEPKERNIGNPDILDFDKARLNKMLTHISYSRQGFIVSGNKGWPIASMTAAILGELERFFAQLGATERSWFPSARLITEATEYAKQFAMQYGPITFSTASNPKERGLFTAWRFDPGSFIALIIS